MTKLDAINRMLRSVQATELISLGEETLTYEQQAAIDIFNQTNTFIQGLGWWFNTFVTKLYPDANGYINISPSYLFVEPINPLEDYVVVNGKLYDKDNNSFDFSDKEYVEVEVVELVDFFELPVPMQEYIVIKATEELQAQIFGSITDNSLLKREAEAYNALIRFQNRAADYNVMKNPQMQAILRRW